MLKARIITGASAGREKQMTRKPVSKIIAFVTAVCTMAVMCGMPAVAFAWEGGITKEETVYVVTDSNGAQSDVIVSDHLVNKGKSKTISDETTLTDIENVKGEETFKQKGDALTWKAEGNSIYYQGKTDAEVPVTMDVTYRLNDKVVSGPELQGESGKVEIRIHYENNAEYNGTTVPFIVMTGLIVTDDSFKNIKVTKGKVIDDGEKLLVVGMAAPGLAQTLDIGESDLGIGSTVTITGDADKFAVEDMMTIVTNAFFEDIDSDGVDLDYDDQIKQLDKGTKAIVDGSKQLSNGLAKLNAAAPKLEEGVSQLDEGANKLSNGLPNLLEGAKQAKAGSSAVYNGLLGVKVGLGTGDGTAANPGLSNVLTKVKSGIDTANEKMDNAVALTSGAKQEVDGVSDALGNVSNALGQVSIQSVDLSSANDEIDSAISKVNGYEALSDEQKKELVSALTDAKNKVSETQNNANAKVDTNNGLVSSAKTAIDNANSILSVAGNGEGNYSTSKKLELAETIDSGVKSALSGDLSTGVQGAKTINNKILGSLGDEKTEGTLIYGAYAVSTGLGNMETGIGAVNSGAKQLADGLDELNDKSGDLVSGVDQLSAGSVKLSNGMAKLYNEGIKKIVEMYNDDLKGTLDSVDGMLDAGRGYKTFTKLPSGMDGNVKFIYKTDMTE